MNKLQATGLVISALSAIIGIAGSIVEDKKLKSAIAAEVSKQLAK